MTYKKPTLAVCDLAQESACCKDPNSCEYQTRQTPPPQEPCGIGLTNSGGAYTLYYNFGSDCYYSS